MGLTPRVCSVEGCERQYECSGYCNMHYKRWRKHGDPLVIKSGGQPRAYQAGDRFGRLVVVAYDSARLAYRCLCDCGTETLVQVNSLKRGDTRSCGCLAREASRARSTTHGHARARGGLASRTYKSWQAMHQRCENPHHHKWSEYGARGITVCAHWRSFENFLADMGERPEGGTIDRIDNAGDYEPSNCRWADSFTQNRNRRPKNR